MDGEIRPTLHPRIGSWADLREFVRRDDAANPQGHLAKRLTYPISNWLLLLRLLEYLMNCGRSPLARVARAVVYRVFRRSSIRLGFNIPPNTCGPGLRLPHWGTIVVNGRARLGAGCGLHPGVTVGDSKGRVP